MLFRNEPAAEVRLRSAQISLYLLKTASNRPPTMMRCSPSASTSMWRPKLRRPQGLADPIAQALRQFADAMSVGFVIVGLGSLSLCCCAAIFVTGAATLSRPAVHHERTHVAVSTAAAAATRQTVATIARESTIRLARDRAEVTAVARVEEAACSA